MLFCTQLVILLHHGKRTAIIGMLSNYIFNIQNFVADVLNTPNASLKYDFYVIFDQIMLILIKYMVYGVL